MRNLFYIIMISMFTLSMVVIGECKPSAKKPLVGCIRWDGCWYGSPYIKVVSPKQWHYMLPFYAKVISDNEVEMRANNQEVVDKEIKYAHDAGLDYWAFDYYDPKSSANPYNQSRELYMKSSHKADINFCLVIFPTLLGPIAEWPSTIDALVAIFKDRSYQKVLDNRPLVYVFMVDDTEKFFGSKTKVQEGFGLLRKKAAEAGLGAPYLVAQVWSASQGTAMVESYGYDAVSAYTAPDFSGDTREYPFSVLATANHSFWESCKASGKKFIPIVNTGWDTRPFQKEEFHSLYPPSDSPHQPWYTEPTPAEFANHLRSALDWTKSNQATVEANTVLIYAWNETGEGGRLVPSLNEGAARLKAVKKVLRKR